MIATLEHIANLNETHARLASKIETVAAAREEAENQFAHRVGVDYRAARIDLLEVADLAAKFEAVAGPGKNLRWQQAVGLSLASCRWLRANRPNGPRGTWVGDYPLAPTDARPMRGVNVVYVLYDADLVPCYVGSTSHFSARLRGHWRTGKRWTRWTAFPCRDRDEAYQLEGRLLAEHMPYLNRRRSA